MSERLSNEPQRLEAMPGQHVQQFAQQLIDRAKADSVDVEGDFNGITLHVSSEESVTAEDLVSFYSQESDRRAEEYRKSPEGIKAAEEAESRKTALQEKAEQLVTQLDSLDFSNLEAVVDWIVDFQDASDHIGVSFDKQKVVDTFRSHGFDVGVNTGKDFNGEDSENFAKWLVGQALDGINSVGAIHQVVHKFAGDWKKKFGKQAQTEKAQIEDIRNGLK
ncbi:MAG: hypothetical protein UW63_C0054G0002 [Candidatus Uhrbacteria bacterium GW2011_GWF2_44_350]|uniref:Uncharacterized protein n=1 Tax=Candidatus Uhrbacteria bacterium GW2011_GWF2_44_350 TaxID=1619000 RepID=A0A0G1LLD7_9BACT|nr:MAG: hypothetical protein UW63_C0054G0002 [Candidatus Uhrbacteria bacterium GW2011_GWF2_44_350]HBR80607.1 hypothetical protein [Candidatus Uhrbacteria bacterium]HCU31310.1 hypothetical protein [Candidatus Uhrbacteria bacterium]